uniref:Uncharacterized protein n=2 Tax=Aegilops tauschii subsp. strangulata TaxID=200361 RepID=A0A453QLF5_AEGTS
MYLYLGEIFYWCSVGPLHIAHVPVPRYSGCLLLLKKGIYHHTKTSYFSCEFVTSRLISVSIYRRSGNGMPSTSTPVITRLSVASLAKSWPLAASPSPSSSSSRLTTRALWGLSWPASPRPTPPSPSTASRLPSTRPSRPPASPIRSS